MVGAGRQRNFIREFQAHFGGIVRRAVAAGPGLEHNAGLGIAGGTVTEIRETEVGAVHEKRALKILLGPPADIRQPGEKQEIVAVRQILRIRQHLEEAALLLRGAPEPVGRLQPLVMNQQIEQHALGGDILPGLPPRIGFGLQERAVSVPAFEAEILRPGSAPR